MPKIPKIKPTIFPSQKWMMVERRNPYGKELVYPPITARRPDWYGREMYINERPYPGAGYINEEYWLPIHGPELPADIEEYRRLFDRGNPWAPNRAVMSAEEQRIAREGYFDAIRADLSRQAYNRRVQAWNEYRQLPRRERQFWANRDRLARALDDYDVSQDPAWYTKNYKNFEYVPMNPRPRDIDFGRSMSINPEDYPEFPSFDEFPDDLVDLPWHR